ncbi:MAG TPA: ChbG/HpnK family deacetylase [Anaerolineae bacterium]|jgi:hopanoid biosynthesis associated protein HpnK|nr:ChbG/HpnK family deacetylase [Anaerolineae bacterium]
MNPRQDPKSNPSARLLVVHADDFGLSADIDAGILCAHREGIVTSASLVAGGATFAAAVAAARDTPTLDLGAHLTLVGERPVLDPRLVPSLVGPDGHFHRHANSFAARFLTGRIAMAELRAELASQLERLLATGLPISHLDSHQHLHVLPGLSRLTAELARDHGISFVRLPRERRRPGGTGPDRAGPDRGRLRRLQRAALSGCSAWARRHWLHHDRRHADAFHGFMEGGDLDRAALLRVLDAVGPGLSELMCHPGLGEAPLAHHVGWGYRWRAELEALTDERVRQRVLERGIRLVGYGELRDERAPDSAPGNSSDHAT